MEDPIPMPQDFHSRDMERMQAMQAAKAMNQSRLFALPQNEEAMVRHK